MNVPTGSGLNTSEVPALAGYVVWNVLQGTFLSRHKSNTKTSTKVNCDIHHLENCYATEEKQLNLSFLIISKEKL